MGEGAAGDPRTAELEPRVCPTFPPLWKPGALEPEVAGHPHTCLRWPFPLRSRAESRGCEHLVVAGATEGLGAPCSCSSHHTWGGGRQVSPIGRGRCRRGGRRCMAGRTPAAPASREIASPGLAGFCWFFSLVLSPSPSPRACKRAVSPASSASCVWDREWAFGANGLEGSSYVCGQRPRPLSVPRHPLPLMGLGYGDHLAVCSSVSRLPEEPPVPGLLH